MSNVLATVLTIMPAIVVWVTTVYVFPAVARASFVSRLSEIRNDCVDAILDGQLPNSETTRFFISKVNLMMDEAGELSMSNLLAVSKNKHLVSRLRAEGVPNFAHLKPSERKMMNSLDTRVVDSLSTYLKRGSRFAIPMWTAAKMLHFLPSMASASTNHRYKPQPSPQSLAMEFNRSLNKKGNAVLAHC